MGTAGLEVFQVEVMRASTTVPAGLGVPSALKIPPFVMKWLVSTVCGEGWVGGRGQRQWRRGKWVSE